MLCDFLPGRLGGAKIWTAAVPAGRVCARVFRSLSDARCLPGPRALDSWRLRHLSFTRVCIRHDARHVAPKIDIARGMVSLARPRTRCRSDFVSVGAETLRHRYRLCVL